jgi:hypothetical protein
MMGNGTGSRLTAASLMSVLSLCLISGCSGGDGVRRAPATGTVTVDGTPLPKGRIVLTPEEGNVALIATALIESGRFEMPARFGPVPGNHRVEIVSTDDGGYAPDDEDAMKRWIAEGRKPIKIIEIPPQYRGDGVLKATVTADGPNQLTFDLVSDTKVSKTR